jgi:hypothetical protein
MRSAPFVPLAGGMSQRSTFAALPLLEPLASILALMAAACAHGATAPGFSSLSFDGSIPDLDEAGISPGDDGGAQSPPPTGYLRFADFAPDGLPGFDICVAPHGSSPDAGNAMGPLIGSPVQFPGMSKYIALAAGSYDVSITSQTQCGSSVIPATPVRLADGARMTLAIIGDIQPIAMDQPAQGVVYTDDATGPLGEAAVRFLDVMPGSSTVVFGEGSIIGMFTPLTAPAASGGPPAGPAMGTASDANGYLFLSPVSRATLSAQAPGSQNGVFVGSSTSFSFDAGFPVGGEPSVYAGQNVVASGSNVSWAAGSVFTVALVDGNFGTTPQLMMCQDNTAPGAPSSCTVLMP